MKLVRYGADGAEKPGLIDANGELRDLSEHVSDINGANHTWFCGAWMRNGFHEDGLATGIEAARRLTAQKATILAAAE